MLCRLKLKYKEPINIKASGLYQVTQSSPSDITVLLCRALIELLAFNINVPMYFNFRRNNIRRLADDQSSVQEHLYIEKRVLGIYTNARFSAEATVLQ